MHLFFTINVKSHKYRDYFGGVQYPLGKKNVKNGADVLIFLMLDVLYR